MGKKKKKKCSPVRQTETANVAAATSSQRSRPNGEYRACAYAPARACVCVSARAGASARKIIIDTTGGGASAMFVLLRPAPD